MASEWRTGEVRVFGLRPRYGVPLALALLAGAVVGVVVLLLSGVYVVALVIAGALMLFGLVFGASREHLGMAYVSPLTRPAPMRRSHAPSPDSSGSGGGGGGGGSQLFSSVNGFSLGSGVCSGGG